MSDKRIPDHHRNGVSWQSPCVYIYTSGTTGLPKAATVTHGRTATAMRVRLYFPFWLELFHDSRTKLFPLSLLFRFGQSTTDSLRTVVYILLCLSYVLSFPAMHFRLSELTVIFGGSRIVPLDRLDSRHRSLLERSVLCDHWSKVLCFYFLEGRSCFGKLSTLLHSPVLRRPLT